MRYRIRVKCDCGSELACNPKAIGLEKRCPACSKTFTVPLPCDAFWVVMPNLSHAEYVAHAEALCELDVALRKNANERCGFASRHPPSPL